MTLESVRHDHAPNAMPSATNGAHRPARPVRPAEIDLSDRFVSRPSAANSATPAPDTRSRDDKPNSKAETFAKVAGLSRLHEPMHFIQPARLLLSRFFGGAKAVQAGAHAGHAHGLAALQGLSAGAKFWKGMGGLLGVFGAGISIPIFFMDLREAKHTFNNPEATAKQKNLTKAQLGLSGVSAAAGVGALAAAGIGLLFPPAFAVVAPLVTTSGLSGLGSFVVSLFNRHKHEDGDRHTDHAHTEASPAEDGEMAVTSQHPQPARPPAQERGQSGTPNKPPASPLISDTGHARQPAKFQMPGDESRRHHAGSQLGNPRGWKDSYAFDPYQTGNPNSLLPGTMPCMTGTPPSEALDARPPMEAQTAAEEHAGDVAAM